jgi:P27 family predicted phage terminase small subunit
MARGRRPLPTHIKILRGNPGKRPLPKGEPRPDPTMPEPPAHLGPIAQEEWARIAPELHRIGVLTQADRTTMAVYCQLYERWVHAERYIKEQLVMVDKPTGRIIQNPMVRIARQTLDVMLKYMVELGLTPSSRVKLARGEVPVDDPLEQFLRQGKKPRGGPGHA